MKYKMIQIPEKAHSKLKEYCESNNKKMGREVADIILRELERRNQTQKILRVE